MQHRRPRPPAGTTTAAPTTARRTRGRRTSQPGRSKDAGPRSPRVASPVVPGPVDAPRSEPFAPLPSAADGPPGAAGRRARSRRLDPGLPVPGYARPGDAGVDLRCRRRRRAGAGGAGTGRTGVAIALPAGYAGFVHPRSGLAARTGLSIVNAPGTVDAGYRGEILVCLVNLDPREPSCCCAAATASPSWSCSGSSGCGSSRSPSCRRPSAVPAATGPPAATPGCPVGWRRTVTGSGPGSTRPCHRRRRRSGDPVATAVVAPGAARHRSRRVRPRPPDGDRPGSPPTDGPDAETVPTRRRVRRPSTSARCGCPLPAGGTRGRRTRRRGGRMQAVHVALPAGPAVGERAGRARSRRGCGPSWPRRSTPRCARAAPGCGRSPGEWGRELHATTGAATSLFLGVDGPRWMLYGVATGPTTTAEALADGAAPDAARHGGRARPLAVPGADGAAARVPAGTSSSPAP